MGRGGRTITVGRQGPQKFFQVPKSLEKFLLSASLQPLTANSDCANGGQPKSPRPISAGRHVFILEPGAPRRKEHNMEREEFTVTYELDERMVNRLNRLTERWRAMGREITPEELFGFAMTMDGDMGIKNYLDVVDRFLRRKGV